MLVWIWLSVVLAAAQGGSLRKAKAGEAGKIVPPVTQEVSASRTVVQPEEVRTEYRRSYVKGPSHHEYYESDIDDGLGEDDDHEERKASGYKKHEHNELERGEHHGEKGSSAREDEESGAKGAKHEAGEDEGHYAKRAEGGQGHRHAKSRGHRKGHKSKGFRSVHHKDEYKKDEVFYDEEHDAAKDEEHGHLERGKKEGSSGGFNKGHQDKAWHQASRGKHRGHSDSGSHHSGASHSAAGGDKAHYSKSSGRKHHYF